MTGEAKPISAVATIEGTGEMLRVGVKALVQLMRHLGEKEIAPNQGPVVEWALGNWITLAHHFGEYQAGKLAWCSGAVCTAFLEAGSTEIRNVGHLYVPDLWKACQLRGWTWLEHERVPSVGDLCFMTHADGKVGHVCVVKLVDEARGELTTVGGNEGDSVREHVRQLHATTIYGYARIPG